MIKLDKEQIQIIKKFFENKQFHMTDSTFQNIEGTAYIDNIENPKYACILLKSYCFVNGECNKTIIKDFIDWLPKTARIINPGKEWEPYIKEEYNNCFEKYERYVMEKKENFDIQKLTHNIEILNKKYTIKDIDKELYQKIQNTQSFCTNLGMTEDYLNKGIGVCCLDDKEIIGIATSNIIYNNGIEINLKVNPDRRRQGIASAICSKLILNCINNNMVPSWDAANENSLGLAKKLGYIDVESYNVYLIRK